MPQIELRKTPKRENSNLISVRSYVPNEDQIRPKKLKGPEINHQKIQSQTQWIDCYLPVNTVG